MEEKAPTQREILLSVIDDELAALEELDRKGLDQSASVKYGMVDGVARAGLKLGIFDWKDMKDFARRTPSRFGTVPDEEDTL